MTPTHRSWGTYVLISIVSICATAALIYLTPLKNVALIEPTINDIAPKAFHDQYIKNPDKYLFIDVRPSDVYARSHAPGAISMPLHTLYNTRHALPKSDKEIVLICNEGVASGVGYSYLQHYGFFNIVRVGGGMEKWSAEGLPLEGTAVSSTVTGPAVNH